jgi:plastocyanin
MKGMQHRLVALTVVVALALGLAACGSDDNKDSGSGANTGGTPAAGATDTLTIKDLSFSAVTAKAGGTVTVKNDDSFAHTVTSDESGTFDTGDVDGGATKTFTAPDSPGSYPFHCTIHGNMKGTLTVT